MAALAGRLGVVEVEEEQLVSLVRNLVVYRGSAGMVRHSRNQEASASLTGEAVTDEGLYPDPVRTAPALVGVEVVVGTGIGAVLTK